MVALTHDIYNGVRDPLFGSYRNHHNGKWLPDSPSKSFINRSGILIIDAKYRTVLILITLVVIGYRYYNTSMQSTNAESLFEISKDITKQIEDAWQNFRRRDYFLNIFPFMCGLGLSVFSCVMLYLDSMATFQPNKFRRSKNKQRNNNTFHIGYVTGIASGVVVASLMYLDYY